MRYQSSQIQELINRFYIRNSNENKIPDLNKIFSSYYKDLYLLDSLISQLKQKERDQKITIEALYNIKLPHSKRHSSKKCEYIGRLLNIYCVFFNALSCNK